MDTSQAVLSEVMERTGMNQTELAAALNVTQAAVSQWASDKRTPNAAARAVFDAVLRSRDAAMTKIDAGLWTGPVRVPNELWEPAFRPQGRFRLPLRLSWHGTAAQRWTDARDIGCLLYAYTQIMVDGRDEDIILWVDPAILHRHADRVLWPREYREPWMTALNRWFG